MLTARKLLWRRFSGIPPALLLFLAVILKTQQLSTSPYVNNLLFDSRLATVFIIDFELALSFWLLSGWRQGIAKHAAILTFVVFAAVSAAKIVSGENSCGCFGLIEVPPAVTLCLDFAMIVSLILFQPTQKNGKLSQVAVIGFLVSVTCVFYFTSSLKTTSISEVGAVLGDGMVVVDTVDWEGKRLPLTSLIDGDQAYLDGAWQMVLYHEDCPKCQAMIQQAQSDSFDLPTVFVEVPPLGSQGRNDSIDCLWRSLSVEYEWFVAAPQVLVLEDGIVKRVVGQVQ